MHRSQIPLWEQLQAHEFVFTVEALILTRHLGNRAHAAGPGNRTPVKETAAAHGLTTVTHLVQQAAEGPDVGLEVVPIFMYSLRGHVIRRAHCEETHAGKTRSTRMQARQCGGPTRKALGEKRHRSDSL